MKTILIGGLAVSLLAIIAPAAAQAPAATQPAVGSMGEPGWRAARAGIASSRAEIPQKVQAQFARLDVNRDGFVTRDEAQAGHRLIGTRRPARGALAHGGAERAKRHAADPLAGFDRFDANRDGVITRDEFARHTAVRRAERAARRAQRAAHGPRGFAGGLRGQMFELADANRDGRVSLQEATVAAYQRFDAADLNRDGQLTGEERRQSRQRRRAEHPRG